ncbi:hypothetical protein ACHAXA_011367 [Cyclostephanos tholiformis]|uniref:Dynactin subunit 4 n=1 Tax=Cyclostephanos tholiformis TaxID=382380 RepID=A0ABD3R646_9STRA
MAASLDDFVLYVDHANHLTPLTLAYHATASRHLTSGRSDVIPPSTTVEIDSAYCPRSLTFCDVASALSGDGGCKDCPVCFSPVSISIDENVSGPASNGRLVCHYLCGYCQWSSRECGVTSNADKLLEYSTSNDTDASMEDDLEKQRGVAISDISRELYVCLQHRISEKNKDVDTLFNSIITIWAEREQEEQRRKRMNFGTTMMTQRDVDRGVNSWSREILEESLLEKRKAMDTLHISCKADFVRGHINLGDASGIPDNLPTSHQMAAQMSITAITPQSRSDLLPLPVNYRARVSRRCRAELAAGRTGILIKPKLNPLEGDTSLRTGHGQWWKKDSSALHVVPRVRVCRQGADYTCHKYAALLKVKNPTLNKIRLRLSGPLNSEVDKEDTKDTPAHPIDPRELQNILVNPFSESFVQGRLCSTDAMSSFTPTDFFVLEPADDPFLDVGKGKEGDPSEVRDWDAMAILGALDIGKTSKLRIVATMGDTAWIELVVFNTDTANDDISSDIAYTNVHLAVPLALQIEVGNGSWEAAGIPRRDIPAEDEDLVTLNIFALLR